VGSEYFINSQELEDKVRNLLPSQGGAGAGFDLSASTQIIPIIDLTESAEGSNVRQDLQTSLSFNTVTAFSVNNADTTIVSNTGYFRVFGNFSANNDLTGTHEGRFKLTDGTTTKIIYNPLTQNKTNENSIVLNYDFVVYLRAGESLSAQATTTSSFLRGCTRQIADIDGNLTNP
jgi:hypothetical protein